MAGKRRVAWLVAALGAVVIAATYGHGLDIGYRFDDRHALETNLMPSHYGGHYQLATALLAAGRVDEARVAWRKFVPLAEASEDAATLAAAPEALRVVTR